MHNPVVVTVADTLRSMGYAVLRFNFAGVGRSQGIAGGGPEEIGDAEHALAALGSRLPTDVPIALAGYSFGAWVALELAARAGARVAGLIAVAPPLAYLEWDALARVQGRAGFIVGDRDQFCPADRLAAVQSAFPRLVVHRLPAADHFLAGREAAVAKAVRTLVPS